MAGVDAAAVVDVDVADDDDDDVVAVERISITRVRELRINVKLLGGPFSSKISEALSDAAIRNRNKMHSSSVMKLVVTELESDPCASRTKG